MKTVLVLVFVLFVTITRGDDFIEDESLDEGLEGASEDEVKAEEENEDVSEYDDFTEEYGSGVRPTRPHKKQCIRVYKKCIKETRNWNHKRKCRAKLCDCRKKKCDRDVKKCGNHGYRRWCWLVKRVCRMRHYACRFHPRKGSLCRRKFRKCLQTSGNDNSKRLQCLMTHFRCLLK